MRIRLIMAASIAVLSALPLSAIAQQPERCDFYYRLAEKIVPQPVGNPEYIAQLLRAGEGKAGAQIVGDPCGVLTAVGEANCAYRLKKTCRNQCSATRPTDPNAGPEDDCIYRLGDDAVLRVQQSRGKVKYLNNARSFDANRGVPNEVPQDKALEVAMRTALLVGVPEGEIDPRTLNVSDLHVGASPLDGNDPVDLRAEVHVRFGRQVAETPVFDSGFQGAVDSRAEVARLHLTWPPFRIAGGLDPQQTSPRSRVIDALVERLLQSGACGAYDTLRATVAYVPAIQLDNGIAPDEEQGKARDDRAYVPALNVTAVPDLGENSPAGLGTAAFQFLVPLLATGVDDGGQEPPALADPRADDGTVIDADERPVPPVASPGAGTTVGRKPFVR